MMRMIRRFWYRLTRRTVWLRTTHGKVAGLQTSVSVDRWERWTRPGYYFETEIKRFGEEWQKVIIIPEEIRDDHGRLISLRVNFSDWAGMREGKPYWIDGPTLTKRGDQPEPLIRSANYPHTEDPE